MLAYVKHLPPEGSRTSASPLDVELRSQDSSSSISDIHYGTCHAQLNMIGVPNLHAAGFKGKGVTVLILDSGFDLQHPALANVRVVNQRDFIHNDHDVSYDPRQDSADQVKHGTSTLALLGGYDSKHPYVGAAFEADFLLAKTEELDREWVGEEDRFVEALEWGEQEGADVVSASLGYTEFHSFNERDGTNPISMAIDIAMTKGVVVLTAVGNSARKGLDVPADSFYGLACGSVTMSGGRSGFSSVGPTFDGRNKPEVCAPG